MAHLTREEASGLRDQVQRQAAWTKTLVRRCRELQMWEHEPILAAAVKTSIALADLEREAMRCMLAPHDVLKEQDGRKGGEVQHNLVCIHG